MTTQNNKNIKFSPRHWQNYLVSSTALVDVLRHLSAKSFLLNFLHSSSLQDLVYPPLGSHVFSSVLWRERKITRTDSGLPCSLDLLPEDRAPEVDCLQIWNFEFKKLAIAFSCPKS